jgi:hypothetical protein
VVHRLIQDTRYRPVPSCIFTTKTAHSNWPELQGPNWGEALKFTTILLLDYVKSNFEYQSEIKGRDLYQRQEKKRDPHGPTKIDHPPVVKIRIAVKFI